MKKQEVNLSLGQEVPIFPWTKLATNLSHFKGDSYLLIVDYTSQFPIVHKLKSMTEQHIVDNFKQIFAEYGWPDTIISNNGPCYTSEIFKELMREYQVNHIKSLPPYLQSNGLAKKYVQIVKNLFHKVKEEGQDLHKCLMVYRNTPLSRQLQSPMQILTSRTARSSLPLSNAASKQMGIQCENLRNRHKNQHLPTHDLNLNQTVMYQEPASKKSYSAMITRLCDEARSYIITTEEGTQYKKMQAHLKPYQTLYKKTKHELKSNKDKHSCDKHIQLRSRSVLKPPERLQI